MLASILRISGLAVIIGGSAYRLWDLGQTEMLIRHAQRRRTARVSSRSSGES